MSTRVLLDTTYTFTPLTKTITIPRYVPRERLVLITNVTANIVIYNFSDPTLGLATATGYSYNSTGNITTLILTYGTSSMSASDKLQITIDEPITYFSPSESYMDPVGKLRVSTPQSLIDTDFEYGLQPTKWENLLLINNRPGFFINNQNPLTISAVSATNGSRVISVTVAASVTAGTPILVADTTFSGANGDYLAETTGTTFTYTARSAYTGTTGSIYNSALTAIYSGQYYTGSGIAISSFSWSSGLLITVNTTFSHGLNLGNPIYIVGTSQTNANGSWVVASVLSPTQFTYYTAIAVTGTPGSGALYPRPEGSVVHRAFDGGISFSPNNYSHGQQILRQTRRYFRYQSGKGIQMSTNVIFRPNVNIDAITSSGTTVTVITKQIHNLNKDVTITVSGCNESAYNGNYTVYRVIDANTFQYLAQTTPSAGTASGLPSVSATSWYGSGIRAGMFDNQNGFYFEFDGQIMYAVRRTSTYQISGYVNVTNGSTAVTGATVNGTSTKFSKQLLPNDYIVIRGMTYKVIAIASDTAMTIYPEYRGSTLASPSVAIVTKTIDTRIPQSQWNIDRCDGTGPSGYNLDLTKTQMLYMDYSWYGAGAIRFGFKNSFGEIIYVHRIVNNNQLTEAYMRSGNLPGRYEIHTFPVYTALTVSMTNSDSIINVADTTNFPSSGTVLIENEFINYTSKTSTTLSGLTRGQSGIASLTGCATILNSPTFTTNTVVTGIQVGQLVIGSGIPNGAYIVAFSTGATNTIVLSIAATATASSLTFTLAPMGTAAAAHTYSATAPLSVQLHAPMYSPIISHWGTSVIMDGRFDEDKSFIFSNGMITTVSIANNLAASGATPAGNALMAIRLAPSVDNGVTGILGNKEIINRMQLTLRQIDLAANGLFLISFILNPQFISSQTAWTNVGGSSLVQFINFSAGITVTGGETIYAFYTNPSGGANVTVTQQDLTILRDLGNSVLGGGTDANFNGTSSTPFKNIYPDGPDVLVVYARNIDAATPKTVQARISWSEAQA
jgi:hypothetical protein